jgi:hypothetical protein
VTGVFIFIPLMVTKHDPVLGLNAGFLALCCNLIVVAAVSHFKPAEAGGFHEPLRASIGWQTSSQPIVRPIPGGCAGRSTRV